MFAAEPKRVIIALSGLNSNVNLAPMTCELEHY